MNDGAPGQPFCRNGSWVADEYNGATLDMLVADSCGDSNAWCRDDPYHLDLVTSSVNRFQHGGRPVGDLLPNHWNNRRVSWEFMPPPDYQGDIQIRVTDASDQFVNNGRVYAFSLPASCATRCDAAYTKVTYTTT